MMLRDAAQPLPRIRAIIRAVCSSRDGPPWAGSFHPTRLTVHCQTACCPPGCVMKRGLAVAGFSLALAWTLSPRPAYPHNPTTTTVLFNREIATLLQRKCLQCHADGKMAMPLTTYAQARPWAEAIKEEALARRMPPWPAERGFGVFSNDIGLTPREFEFLTSWIDGGVPEGTD